MIMFIIDAVRTLSVVLPVSGSRVVEICFEKVTFIQKWLIHRDCTSPNHMVGDVLILQLLLGSFSFICKAVYHEKWSVPKHACWSTSHNKV